MQEIEIKAHLKNKDSVMEALTKLGCAFAEPITQEDTVYVENIGSMEIFMSNKAFLRIRVKNKSDIIFTVKKRTAALVAIEHEVKVDNKEEMENILALLGYQEIVRINKVRIITHYNGCEICIDEVEGLGSFIEMEKMAEQSSDDDAKNIQEELFQFFETLGITREDRVTKGYDILMFERDSLKD